MPEAEPFLLYTQRLNKLGLPYMVSGSVAAMYYGEPRLTHDIDIVLELRRGDIERFAAAFPGEAFYCPPTEVIRLEQAREERGHFNLIHHDTGFKADLYLARNDALHRWGLANTRVVTFRGERISLAPPEYVILRKLQFYREGESQKHLRDIHRMLLGLGEEWDRTTLLQFIASNGLAPEWNKALAVDE